MDVSLLPSSRLDWVRIYEPRWSLHLISGLTAYELNRALMQDPKPFVISSFDNTHVSTIEILPMTWPSNIDEELEWLLDFYFSYPE